MSIRYMSAFGAVVLGLLLAGTLDAAPYQELEHREGYVPVYIREGNTPLIEINPKLAEAFNEIDTRNLLESDEPELEKKPDLILMSVDDADAMLIAQPADQVMSEDEPVEVIAIVPAPVAESQDESDIAEIPQALPIDDAEANSDDKVEEGEAPQPELNSQLLEQVRDAIIEEEQQQPELEENKEQPKIDEEVGEVPVGAAADDSNDDEDRKIIEDDDKPQEQATDVSTVDAFKTKEIDVKSIETEKIDVPEEESSATVSIDE